MNQNKPYQSGITRRQSLKWLGILSASAALPSFSAGASAPSPLSTSNNNAGHWPSLKLAPITAPGYGKDPNLIMPPASPWPKTLTAMQLTHVAILADIVIPREGKVPSGSEVGVPDFIDEWVSAPYPRQQEDRVLFLNLLQWLDDESELRFEKDFVSLTHEQQLNIIDDIAYDTEQTLPQFQRVANAFNRFKRLMVAAFFCSPEGTKDLGYQGNVAIAGDYPGPTSDALTHLEGVLADLGLSAYAFKE